MLFNCKKPLFPLVSAFLVGFGTEKLGRNREANLTPAKANMIKDATAYISVSPVTGVYRYRRDIPVALRAGVGKPHYRVSLKTKDYRHAVIKASLLANEHDRLFAKLKPSVADLKRLCSPQQDYNDVIGWLKSNGYGPDITPDMPDEVCE